MTAVSLINPYAPQPAQSTTAEAPNVQSQTISQTADTATGNMSGGPSDQSGQGAGNGEASGGSQTADMLSKIRADMAVQRPTLQSVFEAQSQTAASAYLERQIRLELEAQENVEAEADRTDFAMPNPIPTAPILERDDV